jgi:hypothetical protein
MKTQDEKLNKADLVIGAPREPIHPIHREKFATHRPAAKGA